MKTNVKGMKLGDGKCVDGKNRLTEFAIGLKQNYYDIRVTATRQKTYNIYLFRL
jgi:hypothetical protein